MYHASYNFDEKKTLRISGVSKLLHDEIAKALQETNSTGFTGDVERICVCPGGEDYVLVEFFQNIEVSHVNDLQINHTSLTVEKLKSKSDNKSPSTVSKVWHVDNDNLGSQGKDPGESFTVNSLLLRYIMMYHYDIIQNLENVSKKIEYEVKPQNEKLMKIIPLENVDEQKYLSAINDFIDFYLKNHEKMRHLEIDKKVFVNEIPMTHFLIVDSLPDKIILFGRENNIKEAEEFLKRQNKSLTSRNQDTSNVYPSTPIKLPCPSSSPNVVNKECDEILSFNSNGKFQHSKNVKRTENQEGHDSRVFTKGNGILQSNLDPNAQSFSPPKSISCRISHINNSKVVKADAPRSKIHDGESTVLHPLCVQQHKSSCEKDEKCTICLSEIGKKKTLEKCGHSFCVSCIEEAFKHNKKCPVCSYVYGAVLGDQPEGTMSFTLSSQPLPGYPSCGTICIKYSFPQGIQGKEHPNPGKPYQGTKRHAYLPDNEEGNKVLRLLQIAFKQKLTFTIGRSLTTGAEDVITWNDIRHKTNVNRGPFAYGYPDPTYLKRVQEELAAKGIVE